MYKLYHSPGSCSMAVHVALNECNQEVALEKVDLKGPRSPEFLKLNPRGSVPVLVDGDNVIREGAAILMHILDKHKSPLLPQSGMERTNALQWLCFANATLHPSYSRCFFIMRNAKEEQASLLGTSVAMINKLWGEVEKRLGSNKFLAGDNITMGDILMTVIANWSPGIPGEFKFGPHTKKLFQTVIERPAFKKAMEAEQVTYKVAA